MSDTSGAISMSNSDGRWPVWKLALMLYPFTAATVAINLFLLGLISHAIGWPEITPVTALVWSIPLGVPATWLAGRWVRSLMDEAED
ncbi:hypothetical protein [Shimia biformata]|uniref:hypothetical protein n=1 Tax=Shimia biformata TaxID=1294299 RepID=UPI001EF26134|nr:hypothetical protein [Shimia biformata]